MNFQNKHIFIIGDVDKFFYLQADALINKAGINPGNFCAVVLNYSDKDKFDTLKRLDGVSYVRYSESLLPEIVKAKTITTISLSSLNSNVINKIINVKSDVINKLFVLITDDEVARWKYVYEKKGKLVKHEKKLISSDDIQVLKKLKYVIAKKETFESLLFNVLGRKIQFIDCGIIFDTLLSKSHNKLESLLLDHTNTTTSLKLLWGTKGISIRDCFDFLIFNLMLPKRNKTDLSFIILNQNNPLIRFLMESFRIFIKVIKKNTVQVNYFANTDALTYTSIVMSCTHILLQGRGGASTARTYAKLARGIICVRKSTHNSCFFENSYKINLIKYSSLRELASKIMLSKPNLQYNSEELKKSELEWLDTFKKLYS